MVIREKAAPHQGLTALSSTFAKDALTGTSPLRADVERRLLHSEAYEYAQAAAWSQAARSYAAPTLGLVILGVDLSARVAWRDGVEVMPPRGSSGIDLPPAPTEDRALREGDEPFLHVIITTPDETYHLSELDRPVGRGDDQAQLEARILEVGPIAHRFAEDHGIARSVCGLKVANYDRAFDWLLRFPSWGFLQTEVEIRVGFRHLPPSLYRSLGRWSITAVDEEELGQLTLELQDCSEQLLGVTHPIPTMDAIFQPIMETARRGLEILAPITKRYRWPLYLQAPPEVPVPVLFGAGWAKAVKVWAGRPVAVSKNDQPSSARSGAVYVIGASRNPDALSAMIEFKPGSVHDVFIARGPHDAEIFWGERGGPIVPQGVEPILQRTKVTYEGTEWWVWSLVVGGIVVGYPGAPHGYRVVDWLKEATNDAMDLWVRWERGAAGRSTRDLIAWQGRIDPASTVQELAFRYLSGNPIELLEHRDFEEVREADNRGHDPTLRGLAGVLEEGAGVDLIDGIGRSFSLDLWWSSQGRLRIRTRGVTSEDLTDRIPAARRYDARWDILRGSWTERVPLGSERWGLANSLRLVGLQAEAAYPSAEEVERAANALGAEHRRVWGRVLERDLDMTWRAPSIPQLIEAWHPPVAGERPDEPTPRFHHRITFRAPLYALELELGEWVRVTHWAGQAEEGGYQDRLIRIEGITLDWRGKQVEIEAVDFGWLEDVAPGVLDLEAHWVRFERPVPDGMHQVATTEASRIVRLEGPQWAEAGLQPGDFLIPIEDRTEISYRIESLAEVGGEIHATLEEPMEETKVIGTFRVQRSHLDPPSDADWPGRYPVTDRFYVRLADEVTEQFSDGAPAYRLVEE